MLNRIPDVHGPWSILAPHHENDACLWQRTHFTPRPITVAVTQLRGAGWLVLADCCDLQARYPGIYASFMAAQRTADDVLRAHRLHDCEHAGYSAWEFRRPHREP
jgi:hypothetical protein